MTEEKSDNVKRLKPRLIRKEGGYPPPSRLVVAIARDILKRAESGQAQAIAFATLEYSDDPPYPKDPLEAVTGFAVELGGEYGLYLRLMGGVELLRHRLAKRNNSLCETRLVEGLEGVDVGHELDEPEHDTTVEDE